MTKMLFAIMIVLLITGCSVANKGTFDFSIRMTAEQIKQGSFTGGRLIFSENAINQLEEGMLIPILDKTQAFVFVDDVYEFRTIEENYGYYYVVAVSAQSLTLDYVLYDESGKIIAHEEGITLSDGDLLNRKGETLPQESIGDLHYGLNYSGFSARGEHFSRELQGASLLSFPKDVPSEEEQMNCDPDKQYRTVLFRLQKSGTQPYDYNSGVVSAHESEPFLVIDSAYYDETNSAMSLISINDPDLPEIEVGDYILDSSTATARQVSGIIPTGGIDGFQTFETDVVHIQQAVGALRIQLQGDLAEIIQRYGSEAEKERLQGITERKHYDIWDSQATASLWKGESCVQLEVGYKSKLGVNMDFKADVTWHEVSAKGTFSVESNNAFETLFMLDGHTEKTEKKGTFFTIPLEFEVEKFKIGIELNVVADYVSEEATPVSLDYIISMHTGPCEFGVDFDAGAKLAFKWGFIPYPKMWCQSHVIKNGFNKASAFMDQPHLKQLEDNTINIGIDALFDFDLFKAFIFNLDANVGFSTTFERKELQDYDWWADIGVYGSLEHLKIGVGIPFSNIGHTWDLGTIWTLDPKSETGHITSIPLDNLIDP